LCEDRHKAAARIRATANVESTLHALIAWIEWHLKNLEHRRVYDVHGNAINHGMAFSPIPDWDMRQKLESLRDDLATLAAEVAGSDAATSSPANELKARLRI
jgi:hypothetical protein